MSEDAVTYPIVSALVGAEEILGPDRNWTAINDEQARFLKDFFAACRGEIGGLGEIIKTKASWDIGVINQFLKDNGFTIQLDDTGNPDEFGVASILRLLVEWLVVGKKTSIERDNREYPAVRLTDKKSGVTIAHAALGPVRVPVACLPTKGQDKVYLAPLPDPPRGFDLIETAEQLMGSLGRRGPDYEGVIFPMVDLDLEHELDWLLGMEVRDANDDPFHISQALQQTRLKMNHKGALAESAVAIGVMRSVAVRPKVPLVIDQPFLCWFTRPGLAKPLFVCHVTEEDWKDPGEFHDQDE